MKKRILAMLLAMCCLVAVLCVFCGCNTTPANTDGKDNSQDAAGKNSTPTDVKKDTEIKTDDTSDTDVVANNNGDEDEINTPIGCTCFQRSFETDSLVELEQLLEKVDKCNPFCMVLFDMDNGLPCLDADKNLLESSIYYFGCTLFGDNCLDLESYVFPDRNDMTVAITFETKSGETKDGWRRGRPYFYYLAYFSESSFTKEDIRFVELERLARPPIPTFDYHGTWIHLYEYDVYAGSELVGQFLILCPEDTKYTILQEFYDRMVIVNRLGK